MCVCVCVSAVHKGGVGLLDTGTWGPEAQGARDLGVWGPRGSGRSGVLGSGGLGARDLGGLGAQGVWEVWGPGFWGPGGLGARVLGAWGPRGAWGTWGLGVGSWGPDSGNRYIRVIKGRSWSSTASSGLSEPCTQTPVQPGSQEGDLNLDWRHSLRNSILLGGGRIKYLGPEETTRGSTARLSCQSPGKSFRSRFNITKVVFLQQ